MSRIQLIADARRPKMNARALFQGPQGSGKTWTMLSVARSLTAGTDGRILGIDTERESMLTYADVFSFKHLPWRPPYSPDELTQTLDQLARTWVQSTDDVVLIDSSSHFWQGSGGILDIAGGRVQGGWDKARPMQQALVESMLALPCHLLLGARMKNSVLVSDNGKSIENVGLTIVQDETLGYELNIVVQMDMSHNISVMKSRTPAVPVGRLYPGGSESKLAADYAEWLAGGIPPANREDVEAIVEVFAGISDAVKRKALKDAFVEDFGSPHSLTADQVPAAREWLAAQGAAIGEGPGAEGSEAAANAEAGTSSAGPDPLHDPDGDHPDGGPDDEQAEQALSAPAAAAQAQLDAQRAAHAEATSEPSEAPEGAQEPADAPAGTDPAAEVDWPAYEAQLVVWADELKGKELQDELEANGLSLTGQVAARRERLVAHVLGLAKTGALGSEPVAPGTEAF